MLYRFTIILPEMASVSLNCIHFNCRMLVKPWGKRMLTFAINSFITHSTSVKQTHSAKNFKQTSLFFANLFALHELGKFYGTQETKFRKSTKFMARA